MIGKKFDQDKPRIDLIPNDALLAIARVMGHGVEKYGEYNWANGMKYTRLISAAYRHLGAFNNGEDIDPESGLEHLAQVATNMIFLLMYQKHSLGLDDRKSFKSEFECSTPIELPLIERCSMNTDECCENSCGAV